MHAMHGQAWRQYVLQNDDSLALVTSSHRPSLKEDDDRELFLSQQILLQF